MGNAIFGAYLAVLLAQAVWTSMARSTVEAWTGMAPKLVLLLAIIGITVLLKWLTRVAGERFAMPGVVLGAFVQLCILTYTAYVLALGRGDIAWWLIPVISVASQIEATSALLEPLEVTFVSEG